MRVALRNPFGTENCFCVALNEIFVRGNGPNHSNPVETPLLIKANSKQLGANDLLNHHAIEIIQNVQHKMANEAH